MCKRFISLFLCLFIVSPYFLIVKAEPVTVDKAKMIAEMKQAMQREFVVDSKNIRVSSAQMQNLAKVSAPIAVAYAPEIALIASIAIAGGYVFANRDELIAICSNIYNDIIGKGGTFKVDENGNISIDGDVVSKINDDLMKYKVDGLNGTDKIKFDFGAKEIKSIGLRYKGSDGKVVTSDQPLHGATWFSYTTKFSVRDNVLEFAIAYSYKSVTDGVPGITNKVIGLCVPENFIGVDYVQFFNDQPVNYPSPGVPSFVFLDPLNYSNMSNVSPVIAPAPISIPSIKKDYFNIEDLDNFVGLEAHPLTSTDPSTDPNTQPNTGTKTATSEDIKQQTKDISDILDKSTNVPKDDTPSLNFKPLQVSLSDKFPFCVPFDLIKAIKSFSVNAKAPKFDIKFPAISFGQYGTLQESGFTWDFSIFSKVVLILRYFLLIAFVIELIKLTRTIIRG